MHTHHKHVDTVCYVMTLTLMCKHCHLHVHNSTHICAPSLMCEHSHTIMHLHVHTIMYMYTLLLMCTNYHLCVRTLVSAYLLPACMDISPLDSSPPPWTYPLPCQLPVGFLPPGPHMAINTRTISHPKTSTPLSVI